MRIKKLRLKKLNNARDLGGMPAADGKVIKHGKLIRSGRLYSLPEKTLARLKDKGVTAVIDMRIDTEVNEHPDNLPEGAKYYRLPLLCTATAAITHDSKMLKTMTRESKRIRAEFGNADNYMKEMYRRILTLDESREQLKKFFEILIDSEGCVLWHCSAGKDRAGIAAMLLEGLLGVDDKLIIADYVASQRFQFFKHFWQRIALWIIPVPHRLRAILLAMMNAKRKYIIFALEEIRESYGGIENYCKQALLLTDGQIQTLKEKYLE